VESRQLHKTTRELAPYSYQRAERAADVHADSVPPTARTCPGNAGVGRKSVSTLSDSTRLNDVKPTITTGPIPGSRKHYITTERRGLRVPVRRIDLTNGDHFDVYDTSGPYTDPDAEIDVHRGLP